MYCFDYSKRLGVFFKGFNNSKQIHKKSICFPKQKYQTAITVS